MKINKRLIIIGISCFIASIIIVLTAFKTMKDNVEPEERVPVLYFRKDVQDGVVVSEENFREFFKTQETPISLVPKEILKADDIYNKMLVKSSESGQFATSDYFIERGEIKEKEADSRWIIGINVDDISNFLGCQLKKGDKYALVFIEEVDEEVTAGIVNQVEIVNMVDSTGRLITENSQTVAKTVNVSVRTPGEVTEIARCKNKGKFEMVRPSENWEFEVVEDKGVDESGFNEDRSNEQSEGDAE